MLNIPLPFIDIKRDKTDMPARVLSIDHYNNCPVPLAKIEYEDGETGHILAPIGLHPGDTVLSAQNAPLKPGNTLSVKNIPLGMSVHNVEIKIGGGGQLVRSAGSCAQVIEKGDDFCALRLPSGKTYRIQNDCRATLGRLSHVNKSHIKQARFSPGDTENTMPTGSNKMALEPAMKTLTQQSTAFDMKDDAELMGLPRHIITESGCEIRFSVVAKNTGSKQWGVEGDYHLGWLRGYEYFITHKQLVLDLDSHETVHPAMSKRWDLAGLIAPIKPGIYQLIWQMYTGDFNWFGDKLLLLVEVKTSKVTALGESVDSNVTVSGIVDSEHVKQMVKHKPVITRSVKTVHTADMKDSRQPLPVIPASSEVAGLREEVKAQEIKPVIIIDPPIGPPKTKFKVHITGCTPGKEVVLRYQDFAREGWATKTKKINADKNGRVTANISWKKSGTYDVWAVDDARGVESKIARVIVL